MTESSCSVGYRKVDMHPPTQNPLHAEVVEICQKLIRFDTSNFGDCRSKPERPAAEYVAEILAEAGLEPELFEARPGRTNVVARLAGMDQSRGALLVHGHLDVVPVDPDDWSADPFGGEIRDGELWGRGAVDMKNMLAMILASIRQMRRAGQVPARDLVFAFLADEEAGGEWGSRFLVREHPHLFGGCTEAISEVGGFSADLTGARRPYFVEIARKGIAWMRLTGSGAPSHAALPVSSSALTDVIAALHRVASHQWPLRLTKTTRRMLDALDGYVTVDLDNAEAPFGDALPGVADLLTGALRHVVNPTSIRAGDVINIVPGSATATLDGRFVPGLEQEFLDEVARLVGPKVGIELVDLTAAGEEDFHASIVTAMERSLRRYDAAAELVPYTAAASTDNPQFAELGIAGYGFVPLQLPPNFRFTKMFHGVNERIPVESLHFGVDVLLDFLLTA